MSDFDLAIGLDLGTSGLKGVAIRGDGSVAAAAEASYPTARPLTGRAEQSPRDWIEAARTVAANLAGQASPDRWDVIGLAGMIPTLVAIGGAGDPLEAAITWEDVRAEEQGARLRDRVGPHALYARTGQWVDGRYLLPLAMWLREREPHGRGAMAGLAGAKDWLYWWLTGDLITDPATATGYGCFDLDDQTWSQEILAAALGHALPSLPEVRPCTTLSAMSRKTAGFLGLPDGLPICVGAADSVLAARGLGVQEPGGVCYVAGTSTVILGVSADPVRDRCHRYLVTPMDREGRYALEMDLVSTGSAVRWLTRTLGLGEGAEERLWSLAEDSALGSRGLVFLPYLGPGEQGALWDPSLRGALAGLTLAHTPADLARALLEGITLESRRCLAVLSEAGLGSGEVALAGPAAHSRAMQRALADATGRVVRSPGGTERVASAWGAAALALEAMGMPAPAAPDPGSGVPPDPAKARSWAELWERHERARSAWGAFT